MMIAVTLMFIRAVVRHLGFSRQLILLGVSLRMPLFLIKGVGFLGDLVARGL